MTTYPLLRQRAVEKLMNKAQQGSWVSVITLQKHCFHDKPKLLGVCYFYLLKIIIAKKKNELELHNVSTHIQYLSVEMSY